MSGRFSGTAGNGTCDFCEAGKYTAATKQSDCSLYGPGEGCTARATGSGTEDGCKLIEDCPPGKYSGALDSECEDIPAGYQCTALSSGSSGIDADSTKCASIGKCAFGSYSAVNTNRCEPIPAGKKCSANYDGAGITATSEGCTAIAACPPTKYSLVNVNECDDFSACSAGDYVKTAPGGDATNGYTTDRECEKCKALGAFYRTGTPVIGQLTADSTATTCSACGTCSGATPIADTACTNIANTVCRAINPNTDCSGQCTNGNDVCTAFTNPKTPMTCGQCNLGYSGSDCTAITCTCTNGSPVTTSATGSTNDENTCINSGDENCDSCASDHNLVNGASPNGKICSAVECSCAGGIAKSIAQGCTDIDDTSGPHDCQSCNTDFGFATVDGRSTCGQCAAHEYAVAGTNACAAKSFECQNGTPAADATSSTPHSGFDNDAENCASCNADYYLDSADKKCKECGDGKHTAADNTAVTCTQNSCTCNNGDEATGTACTADATEICVSCTDGSDTDGYELNGAKKCARCDNGEISNGGAVGTNSVDGTINGCRPKQCTCTNGALDGSDGAEGDACTADNTDICKSNPVCASGYVKSQDSITLVWTCIAQCVCTDGAGTTIGTGDTGDNCNAAGAEDCASCDSLYGRYLKEDAATSDDIHVCVKCEDFGDAFQAGANVNSNSAGVCALDSCPLGEGYNMPSDLNADTFKLYLAEFEVNTFRGATLISTGEFKCRDCSANQFSNDTATGQCELILSTEVCVTYKSGAASGEGCEKVCTTQDNAATYNAADCSVASCDSGYEVYNGACVAECEDTGAGYYRDGNGDCIGKCPATASGGTDNEAFTGSCSSVQDGNTCAVDCTHTDRNNDDGVVTCTAGDATTAGTWSTLTSGTCLLNTGKVCGGAAECADDYCYDGDSDSSDKECYASAQTCDGTSVTWANATRRTTAQGGGGSANDPLTATEADESTIIFRCTYGATASAAHATNTFTCSSGTFTGDGTAACPTQPPPPGRL